MRANRARPADVANQYVAQGKNRHRLGLCLRRLDHAAGGVDVVLAKRAERARAFPTRGGMKRGVRYSPSKAASRSACARSSTVLALKNGSSGSVTQVTVARR